MGARRGAQHPFGDLVGIAACAHLHDVVAELQRGELARQQLGSGEVTDAGLEALLEGGGIDVEVHEDESGKAVAQDVAVRLLECRTGEHDRTVSRSGDRGAHPLEPGSAFGVIERSTGVHRRDRLRTVQVVGVDEHGAEAAGDDAPDGRLAGTGHAHDHDARCGHASTFALRARYARQPPCSVMSGCWRTPGTRHRRHRRALRRGPERQHHARSALPRPARRDRGTARLRVTAR